MPLLAWALVALVATSLGCSQLVRGSAGNLSRSIEITASEGDAAPFVDDLLEIGSVAPGGRIERPIWLRNHTKVTQRITSYSSTCECLSIVGLPVAIAAGATAPARVCIDMQDEPNSRGNFEVVATLVVTEAESLPLKVRYRVPAGGEVGDEPTLEPVSRLKPIAETAGAAP